MNEKLSVIREEALAAVKAASSTAELNDIRVRVLGKKGELTAILRSMGSLAPEDRPKVGQMVNEARAEIESAVEARTAALAAQERDARLKAEALDVTIPGKKRPLGKLHPLTQTYYEMRDIFVGMGFTVAEGPEVEYDKYNFTMLNIPKDHPARDMQDTFYVNDDIVLRTHTSPVQVRTMLSQKPPIRIISPGRVYRSDDVDATHSPIFNQI